MASFKSKISLTTIIPILTETAVTLAAGYKKTTPKRVKLLDSFIVFNLYLYVLQMAYAMVVGDFPYNAKLAGIFAGLGQAVLGLVLRVLLQEKNVATVSKKKSFAEYLLGTCILFLFLLNFLG
jgi:oligosaccharyltransferase complex subunit epsilon